jgi:hypothetical protein
MADNGEVMTEDDSSLVPSAAPKRRPPNAGKGRVKGVPNKSTAAVKAAMIEAFDQLGGVPSLVKWGKDNQGEFYKLWIRLLPTEVSGPDGAPIQAQILDGVASLPKERRDAIRAALQGAVGGAA